MNTVHEKSLQLASIFDPQPYTVAREAVLRHAKTRAMLRQRILEDEGSDPLDVLADAELLAELARLRASAAHGCAKTGCTPAMTQMSLAEFLELPRRLRRVSWDSIFDPLQYAHVAALVLQDRATRQRLRARIAENERDAAVEALADVEFLVDLAKVRLREAFARAGAMVDRASCAGL